MATDLGVFVSTVGGNQWAVENSGFANAVTESISILARPNQRPLLFAFTHGRGAWRVPLGKQPSCEPQRWIPHVTPADSRVTTTILATNLGNQANEIELIPDSEDGAPLLSAVLEIPAGQTLLEPSPVIFGEQAVSHIGICGSVKVALSAGYRINTIQGVTAHVGETTTIDSQYLLYAGEWDMVFEGLAVVNLEPEPAEIEAVLEMASGEEVARVTLSSGLLPRAKTTAVLDHEFGQARGDVMRIESTQPLVLLALRGTVPGIGPILYFENEAIPITSHQ